MLPRSSTVKSLDSGQILLKTLLLFQNAITRSLGGADSCASDMLQVGVAFSVFEICCMLPWLQTNATDSILPSQNHENIDNFVICTDHLSCVLALVSCFCLQQKVLVWSFDLSVSYRYTSACHRQHSTPQRFKKCWQFVYHPHYVFTVLGCWMRF